MNKRDFLRLFAMSSVATLLPPIAKANSFVSPKKVLKIAHITDTHIMPFIGAAKGFERCLHHIQQNHPEVDLLLNTGDSIMEAHSKPKFFAQKQWSLFHSVLNSEVKIPILNSIGNHDISCEGDSKCNFQYGKQWATEELGMNNRFYSYDTPFWKIVVLDSVQTKPNGEWYTAHIDEEQWDWLEKELASSGKYILITSHVPLLSASVFFDGTNSTPEKWEIPGNWMHTDMVKISRLLSKFPRVKLAVSGHIHLSDRVEINNITYCCNGAVSGKWWKGINQFTPAGYAIIELYDDGTFDNSYHSY